ncbi:hypothetical protein RFN29_16195 [Mesorhizobium sp. VK22B]|uniref:RNA polymerase sigma factor 70 region 4 type 2 domain-containing protein n=1 Tax=Mesorhizobium captivum TaxID=3072319 RepID=A0ABU4Z1K5_9HYPH|nr:MULTISPECIES: hypothetical protein [unclassified Mesorhizobium]MDX8493112.1 hypothetical protein [Mesorhizobium sp. VK22B]MDX8507642.1 hypothetical protein [Mesorhizobium sp. VK22E]
MTIASRSGQHEIVGPRGGGTSQESTVVRNEPLPVRAEDVSFALMAVLERLFPLERVVFVLCNAFDLTFDEIASVDDLEDRSLTFKKDSF